MLVWCARVNREFGKRLKMEDLDSWSSWNKFSISKDDFYRILDESWEEWQAIPQKETETSEKGARDEQISDLDTVTCPSKRTLKSGRSWGNSHKISKRPVAQGL